MMAIKKLRFLSRLVDREAMRKIVTAHYFGMIYYYSPVWLTENTTSKQWKTLNLMHYRALCTDSRDFKC